MVIESFVWSEEVEKSDMLRAEMAQTEAPREIQPPENTSQNKNETPKLKSTQIPGAGAGRIDMKRRLDLNSWRQALAENKKDAPEVTDVSHNRAQNTLTYKKQENSKPNLRQVLNVGAGLSRIDMKRRLDLNSWRQALAENNKDAPEVADVSQIRAQNTVTNNEKDDSKPKLRQAPNVGAGLSRVDMKRRLDLNSWRQALAENKEESEVT